MKKPLKKLVALITSMALMGNAVVYGYETEKPVLEAIGLNEEIDGNNESKNNIQVSDSEYEILEDGTLVLTKYTGYGGNLTIYYSVNEKLVTKIGDNAFYGCKTVTSVNIQSNIISIGNNAFSGCSSMKTIVIPSNVTSIGSDAFSNCDDNLTIYGEVGSYAQTYANQNNIKFAVIVVPPDDTSETELTPETTTTPIPDNDFEYEILEDGTVCLTKYIGQSNEAVTPEEIDGMSVTSIANYTFDHSMDSPHSTDNDDFLSLTSITISSTITSISDWAITGCNSLNAIIVDEENKNFASKDGVLYNKDETVLLRYPAGKPETSFIIPNNVKSIGNVAFNNCNFTSIKIPSSVTSIGDDAFNKCGSLVSIEIPSSVISIGDSAFYMCRSLVSIEIPSSVISIGGDAFNSCFSLVSIEIPSSVTSIGKRA